jgi:polysaccharide biosynthesis/export protein
MTVMDRQSTISASRVGKVTAWRLVIPAILVVVGFQPASAQSTLRFVSGPEAQSPSQPPAAKASSAWPVANAFSQLNAKSSEIRILEPSNPPQMARAATVPTHDLWMPLSQDAGTENGFQPGILSRNQSRQSGHRPDAPNYGRQDLIARGFTDATPQPQPPQAQPSSPMAQPIAQTHKPIAESQQPIAEAQKPVPPVSRLQPVVVPVDEPVAFSPVPDSTFGESTISIVEVPSEAATPLMAARSGAAQAPMASTAQPTPARTEGSVKFVAKVLPERSKSSDLPATAVAQAAHPPVSSPASPVPVAAAQPERPTMAARLFANCFQDLPAGAPHHVVSPLMDAVAKMTPAEGRAMAAAPVAPPQTVEHAATPVPAAKSVPDSQYAASEPSIAVSAAQPVNVQPKPSERSVLADAPAQTHDQMANQPVASNQAPVGSPEGISQEGHGELFAAPLATMPTPAKMSQVPEADRQVPAPVRIASAAQQSSDNLLASDNENLPWVASRKTVRGHQGSPVVVTPAAARRIETFVYADRKQSAASSAADAASTADHAELTLAEKETPSPTPSVMKNPVAESGTLTEPSDSKPCAAAGQNGPCNMLFGCPYLPGQSGAPFVCGVDCGSCGSPCNATWQDSRCIPWSLFGPGEYVGPARTEHVSTYYLRVNDLITLTFINSRRKEAERYRIGCGDKLGIEWLKSPSDKDISLDRQILVQPDGTISLPLVGEVTAAGKTVNEVSDELTKLYSKYQRDPQITVTPLDVNMGIQDIINAVTSVSGSNGQTQALRVTPEGTLQAPGLGSVFVQGLTLDELRSELEARYLASFGPGLLVSPSLTERATSYVFVGGEVRSPNRYTLEGPTTVMQAITLAGGWNVGGNLHQVVVFRRDENWCLKAIKIDVRAPLYGKDPCPANDVWLRDNDHVIVPKSRILCATDVIELYFTRGVYAVFPINYVYDFSQGSAIIPVP